MSYAFACFDLDAQRAFHALERLALHFVASLDPRRLPCHEQIDARLGWPDSNTDDLELLDAKFLRWVCQLKAAPRPSQFPLLFLEVSEGVEAPKFSARNVEGVFAGAPCDGATIPIFLRSVGRTLWIGD